MEERRGEQERKGRGEKRRREREGMEGRKEGKQSGWRASAAEREEEAGRATCRGKLRRGIWGQSPGVGRKQRFSVLDE